MPQTWLKLNHLSMQDMEEIEGQERDILPEEIKGRRGLEVSQK